MVCGGDLKGACARDDCAVVDGVFDGAEAVADSVFDLGDGVVVGAFDEEGAGLGLGDVFDKGVALFA